MWRFLAAPFIILSLLLLVPAVCTSDSGSDPADSTETGAPGQPGTSQDTRGGAATAASRKPEEGFWEAHPNYQVRIQRQKDVTNYDTTIGLLKDISDRVRLNLNAKLTTRENSTLDRSDASDGTTAALTYKLNDNINFGVNYNAGVDAYRLSIRRDGPVDRKRRYEVAVSSELAKRLFENCDVTVKASGGSTANSFTTVSNQGVRRNFSASVAYAPSGNLKASVNYNASRLNLDSELSVSADSSDSTGSVLKSEDRTASQNLGMTLSYDVLPGVRLDASASTNDEQRQHPDLVEQKQETEKRWSKMTSLSSSFSFWKRVTWDVAVAMSQSQNRFLIQSRRDGRTEESSLDASMKIEAWRGARINLGGLREGSRSENPTADTGDNQHKSLSLKLSQDLGPKADLSLTAMSDLLSVFYDDKETNDKDRDRLSNRFDVDLAYKPYAHVSTKLGVAYSEEQSAYTEASSSDGNKTVRRYRVYGSYDVKTLRDISLVQNYDIGAVYSLYQYVAANNTLVRNANLSTTLRVPLTRNVRINMGHSYKFQDQGSYQDEKYGRSAENESHAFTIGSNYSVGKYLKFVVSQAYYLQRSWKYKNGNKTLDYETRQTDITGRMSLQYSIKERTKVSLVLEQNRKEGDRVNRAFKRYWNVELEASHVF